MRTRQRGVAKRERRDGFQPESSASDAGVCAGDFDCVWILEPPPAPRAREIHRVVALPFLVNRRGHRLGDVSVLALRERDSAVELKKFSADAIVNTRAEVAQW